MLLQPGTYVAEITKAEDTISKSSGRPMMVVELLADGPDGSQYLLRDYIVAKSHRLGQLAEATGQKSGVGEETNPDICVGKTVEIETFIDQGDDKFGPKAAVKAYKARYISSAAPTPPPPATEAKKPEEDLPF